MSKDDSKFKNIKKSIETYIGVPTGDIRKKASAEDQFAAKFVQLIELLEFTKDRDINQQIEYNLNFDDWNRPFYEAIDFLMEMAFPNDYIRQIIYVYLYDRYDETGELMPMDILGKEFLIESPMQLWGVVKYIEANH